MIMLISGCFGQRRVSSSVTYYAVQLIGACGSNGVWSGRHLLGQVAGAIQGVCGGPAEKSLLSIEEDQLQGQVGIGALHGG